MKDGDNDFGEADDHDPGRTDDGVTITNLTASADDGEATVDEANLSSGSDPAAAALTQTGTLNISAPDAKLTLAITGTNDQPVAVNTNNWMSSDLLQMMTGTVPYPDAYPLLIANPTDVDGDFLTITACRFRLVRFYLSGATYVALTSTTVHFNNDPTRGPVVNLLEKVVYRPTSSAADTVNHACARRLGWSRTRHTERGNS